MSEQTIPLADRPAWKALKAHHEKIQSTHLRDLFADDPQRGERFSVEWVRATGQGASAILIPYYVTAAAR